MLHISVIIRVNTLTLQKQKEIRNAFFLLLYLCLLLNENFPRHRDTDSYSDIF